MLWRSLIAWLGLVVVANLNGAFRIGVLNPWLGERAGHQASTVLLSALVLAGSWFVVPWIRPASGRDAWTVGAMWLVLVLAFEFLVGHFVFRNPWAKLLADYDLSRGRIWPLVLVVTLVAPAIVWRLRRP